MIRMLRNWKNILAGAALLAAVPMVKGFALLGPGGGEGVAAKLWQLPAANNGWSIGYNITTDIGAPVSLGEFYRWNTPVITYAFDQPFISYFGANGMKAVDAAMQIFNDIPPTSKMSAELSEFPLSSAHINHEAAQLGLIDLKSLVMQIVLEEIGVADAIRWNYSIRHRTRTTPQNGIYDITRFNYDPVTLAPSSYINGTLWTYQIFESPLPTMVSRTVPTLPPANQNEVPNFPVSALELGPILSGGYYFTSLTRDDVGAIRYLLNPKLRAVETVLPDVTPGGGAWSPYLTNGVTNLLVGGTNGLGLRGGIGGITFKKVHFDSLLLQSFTPVNYSYDEHFISTNSLAVRQRVLRRVTVPDIIFTAADIYPTLATRTDTMNWINNDTLNGINLLGGPGVIAPPIVITLNNLPRLLVNTTPSFIDEPVPTDPVARANGLIGAAFASFDGTTNEPVIYPTTFNLRLQDIRNTAGGANR